jgi:excisionase family DNA binding protein
MTHTGYLTVAEIAAAFRITSSLVYKLAERHAWRRYRLGRTMRYRWDDVDDTMRRRTDVLANGHSPLSESET